MKIGKGNFYSRQGKGKLCSVNRQRMPYRTNLIFGFGTTFKGGPVFEEIGKARTKTGTLPFLKKSKRSRLPRSQFLINLRMSQLHNACSEVVVDSKWRRKGSGLTRR